LIAIAGFAFLVLLLENLYAYRFYDQWAGVWQIDNRPLLGLAFSVIAVGSLVSPRWWQIVLDNLPLRFMAAISYNLYLYHQLVARELFSHHVPPYAADPHDDPVWKVRYTEAAFAITIAQAALVTYCFERPLLRLKGPAGRESAARRAVT
jgi:peptidoglycan/LPS O-acetylase OafA/YrhL